MPTELAICGIKVEKISDNVDSDWRQRLARAQSREATQTDADGAHRRRRENQCWRGYFGLRSRSLADFLEQPDDVESRLTVIRRQLTTEYRA